jgi:hypothetical protein
VSRARRLLPALALTAILVAILANFLGRHEPLGIDFHTYKAAAVIGLEEGWSEIYDQAVVAVAQIQLDPGEVAQPFLSPPTVAWLVAPLVWALMLLWSKPWLDRFRYGPFEWLWRSLARWQLQPMRKAP